jgi:hypothetical protein
MNLWLNYIQLQDIGRRKNMVDLDKLKIEIVDSGMTMVAIAKKSQMQRMTLYNRLAGRGEFTASEIEGISDALRLTPDQRDDIFFAK